VNVAGVLQTYLHKFQVKVIVIFLSGIFNADVDILENVSVYDGSVVGVVHRMRYVTGILLHSLENVNTYIPCLST